MVQVNENTSVVHSLRALFAFRLTGLSGGLFPSLTSSFNFTDYLDALSKIVAVSFFFIIPDCRTSLCSCCTLCSPSVSNGWSFWFDSSL